jgi:hypothetical protein
MCNIIFLQEGGVTRAASTTVEDKSGQTREFQRSLSTLVNNPKSENGLRFVS